MGISPPGKGHRLQLSPPETQEFERGYHAHRDSVLAMLHTEFPRLRDPDELYHEAWLEALEQRARGTQIGNLRALLKTIAWRRARDQFRNRGAAPLDPDSRLFQIQSDPAPGPDETVPLRLEADALRQIIDSLDSRHAAVLKLRFEEDLDGREIQQRLRVTAKHLERIVTEAYHLVEAQLQPAADGQPTFARRQRSLLLACELGLASRRQRERAQRMVNEDPRCAAMLRELRATLKQVAALLPVPVVLEPHDTRLGLALDRLQQVLDSGREQLTAVLPRVSSHAPTIEQASAGGLASLGAGTLAKLGLVCVTAVGGAVVCIESELLRQEPDAPEKRAEPQRGSPPRESPPVQLAAQRTPSRATPTKPKPTRPTGSASANAPEAPSPAPAGSTEFGPGTQGSQPASTVPAAAPSGGGGEFLP
jgi:RNA polymerase sigma factor (sigma-70 family)